MSASIFYEGDFFLLSALVEGLHPFVFFKLFEVLLFIMFGRWAGEYCGR
jgi:hypothetical protein